jgi:hypothetical protein
LLLSAYDKGERASKVHQNAQIEQARQYDQTMETTAKAR